jgi:hypothetical protein
MACLAFKSSNNPLSYEQLMEWVINLGGDTDTNACAAGGMIGALDGYDVLASNSITYSNTYDDYVCINIWIYLADLPRPSQYQLGNIINLIDKLPSHDLGS